MPNDFFDGRYKAYWGTLCSVAFGILNDMDEAQDVVGDTVLNVYRSGVEGVENVKGYLYRSVINAANLRLRQRQKSLFVVPAGELEEHLPDTAAMTSDERIIRAEMIEIIYGDIMRLPELDRKIFVLRCFEGMTFEEIAQTVQKSERTVRTRYHETVKQLKLQLFKRGLFCILLIIIGLQIYKLFV